MSLHKKFLVVSTFVFVAFVSLGLLGRINLSRTAATATHAAEETAVLLQAQDLARSAQVSFKKQVQEWKNILLRGNDAAAYEKYLKAFEQEEASVRKDIEALEKSLARLELRSTNAAAVFKSHAEMGQHYRHALKQFDAAKAEAGKTVDKLVKGMDREATDGFDRIVAEIQAHTDMMMSENLVQLSERVRFAQFAILLAVIVGSASIVAVLIAFIRSVPKPFRPITSLLEMASEHVLCASTLISTSSQSQAESASQQAASIEETSASLEEISSMTKRNAGNAQHAKELAGQARSAAEIGATDMQEMTTAMADIKSASDNIAKILKTIDEIAFQTNLLALNAAVEAARAGEAGAGFAVVADEVRSLAQRAAAAARETADKIADSVNQSGRGVAISGKVAEGLQQIVTKARQVDAIITEIAAASNEQSQGIAQVNVAVSQMDKATQSSAASAEESAAAAEELRAQAETMRSAVGDLERLVGKAAKQSKKVAAKPANRKTVLSVPTGNERAQPVIALAKPSTSTRPHAATTIPLEAGFSDF